MEITTLQVVWFLLIAVLWTGYLVLEGFDFGVGMLIPVLARDDKERRVMINTIAPVWDGNEVWVLTAGGATFAAFPEWYATLFSGFYLALLLILLALIARVVSFEWRGKFDDDRWRAWFDRGIIIGSWLPSILWGVAFGNIVRGVPLDAQHQFVGSFLDLLNPFALLGGATTTLIFLTHGAIYTTLKTDGEIRRRAGALAERLAVVTLVVAGAWAVWLQLAYSEQAWTWAATLVAAVALISVVVSTRQRREGYAFIGSAVAIVFAVVLIFGSLYPDVMPSTIDPATNSLTLANASSSQYTLGVMTWVAVILTPFVLAYQAWTYWVFRKRITVEGIPENAGLPVAKG
ncbi:cytochrome d ubiquinol oxidase subunit II [Isoptericola sp. b441]|uniref:Cytochrome d ubiquinol oxidase subunit II n=1 Tax=Actinotalea lenta TaxID=3064654 RepID=A0ABT9DB78_9CELL|nr:MULTISPECIES: cytochrome d ubiquinol oxidase subunit II [unclassified Isoptericola]MDO8108154.1 cytochrome d ubiquinol oxidase subunit II [Isoptericola sp. b441]MDO8120175.1 cytochrome d ubiquinol oxidase subunit II [Isoptericola sp. b490]